MNLSEISKLLAYCSMIDHRKVDEETVEAWHATIGDLDFRDAMTAAKAHYRHEPETYLVPGLILRGVYRERSRRLDGFLDPLPAADPSDPSAYIAEIRANRKRKADGEEVESGRELTGGPSPEVAAALRDALTATQIEGETA